MKKYLGCCFILLILAGSVFSQNKTIIISGKVIDSETLEPLPFVNIFIKSGGMGTASNLDGKFIFKIPEKWGLDTLLVSCVGYNTIRKPLSGISDNEISIRLVPATIALKEITVNPESGFDILKKALARIPENYDTGTTRLTAFYQEGIWLGDEELAFNEAVLDIIKIFKTEKKHNDRIRIIKGRKKQISPTDLQLYNWIGHFSNGASGSLGDDLIKYKNEKMSPFNEMNFRYYNCEYTESIHDRDRNLIVLQLLPKKKARKGYLQTKVFIDEESLAIVRFDFQLSASGLRWINKHGKGSRLAYTIMSAATGATIDFSHISTSVSYKEHEGKWLISNVQRHWEAFVNSKKRNMTDRLWEADMNLIITDIAAGPVVEFSTENIGNNESSMRSLIGNDYDEEFWENYNILKPSIPDSISMGSDTVAAHTGKPIPFLTVAGSVTDAKTHDKLAYANVVVKGRSIGTVTNGEGEFVFNIQQEYAGDSLQISFIGYDSFTEKIASLVDKKITVFHLDPNATLLTEVSVTEKQITASEVIKTALKRISLNYGGAPFVLQGFLRDWKKVDFQNEDPENKYDQSEDIGLLLEAALNIYDGGGYGSNNPADEKVYLKEIRRSALPDNKGWNYANILEELLRKNHVKYPDIKDFSLTDAVLKFPNTFSYTFDEALSKDNHVVITASTTGPPLVYRFYIDMDHYAIEQIDLLSTKPFARGNWIIDNINNTQRFREWNGRWYLSYWKRSRNIRKIDEKSKNTFRAEEYFTELLVNDIILSESIASPGKLMDPKKPLEFQSSAYNETFWKTYNIIKDNPLDTGIQKFMDKALEKQFGSVSPGSYEEQPISVSNRQNGFTRADTLRGKLTSLRSGYDVTFYHLDVAVDMENRSVKGSNMIRFKVMQPMHRMQIDLYANMKIEKILYNDKTLFYTREFDAVFIQLPEELNRGSEGEIMIYYEGIPKEPDWAIPMNGGFLWDKDEEGNPWVQVVCQGSGASLWWPNKDHLSDEPDSMKIWITVPSTYTEISNGRLTGKTHLSIDQTRYEWFVSYPINNYNVTFNIGKYAHFQDEYITDDTLTIDYYVMPYNLERSKRMFRQVRPMLKCFEKYFDKYPFSRDGFTLVESLYPMEHQSGVCIGKIAGEDSVGTNALMWHESAHEWWGNAISCTDMADLWIHEAFATYAESLMVEFNYGKQEAMSNLNRLQDQVRNTEPIIGVYDVNHIYYDIEDMYSKGALMLNTFRHVINSDTVWFSLLHSIQKRFRYQTLTSEELIAFISEKTQQDYTYFFDQYLRCAELPQLEIELEEQGNDLILKYRWKANVENFLMPVKVTTSPGYFDFIYPSAKWQTLSIKNMQAQEFAVDEDNFYIEVTEIGT